MKRILKLVLCAILIVPAGITYSSSENVVLAAAKNSATISNSAKSKITNLARNGSATVSVRDAKTGKTLYTYNSMKLKTPASNMKIVTAYAALGTLGENYRFKTEVKTTGKISKSGTLSGSVYLKGYGDPTLNKKDLTKLAKALKKQGIKKVNGHVIGDDTYFDKQYVPNNITKAEQSVYYGASVSALTTSPNSDYDTGTVLVNVYGKKSGQKARVTLSSKGELKVINRVTTGGRTAVSASRAYGSNTIVVSGSVRPGASAKKWVAVPNTTKHTIATFKQEMEKQGIKVAHKKYLLKATPKKAKLVATEKSPKLATIVKPFLKLSNNGIGDILYKTMARQSGKSGTLLNGGVVVKKDLTKEKIDTTNWVLKDGSGLSLYNKVTTNQLSKILYKAQSKPYYKTFYEAFPIGGNSSHMDGGTLRGRFTEAAYKNRVYAKTGTLQGVRSLSGYVKQKNGKKVIVSVLTNSSSTYTADQIFKTVINNK